MKRHTSEEAFHDRLRILANVNKKLVKESKETSLGSLIDFKKGADEIYYGIVKENHNFYIKKAVKKDIPNVTDFTYIGGLGNIKDYQYKTYGHADKQRNMLFQSLNEIYNVDKTVLTESEVKEGAKDEIDQAEAKLGDLDAATDAENIVPDETPEMGIGDNGGEEMPVEEPVDGEIEGDEELPTEETPDEENNEEGAIDNADLDIKEIEKNLGKLTNKLRNVELTPSQIKSYVNSYLSAFKDKFPELDIEDRKTMANKILKTVSDKEIEDINVEDDEDTNVEESTEMCSECGGFTQYAESRGYTRESIMECDEDEMGNLVSGYANAHNDGINDGDFETVALFVKPNTIDTLKNEYGHDEYAEKLTPYVDSLTEGNDEDKQTKINELNWGSALKSVGSVIGSKAKQAGEKVGNVVKTGAEKVGQGIKNVAQKTGQAVQNAGENIASAVTSKLDAAKNTIKNVGDEISKNYNAREQNAAVAKLEELASELGLTITKYNSAATKAGGTPVKPESIIMKIRNTINKGSANLSNLKNPALAENDIANVDADQNNQIAADSDNLGVVSESKKIEEISPELVNRAKKTAVNKFYNEKDPQKKEKLNRQASMFRDKDYENTNNGDNEEIDENSEKPSAGLSKEKKSEIVKKAKAGEDIGKKGKGFKEVEKKAEKEYGSKEAGKKVAAAAMWKNVKKEGKELSESEKKVRNYIRIRIEEIKGIRKTKLNESNKSESLKKLDKLIEEQLKNFKKTSK